MEQRTPSYDGKAWCSLAQRVTKTRRSGNLAEDNAAIARRTALMFIIDACVKQPDVIMPFHGILLSQDLTKTVQEKKDEKAGWDPEWKSVHRISREWSAQWLMNECRGAFGDSIVSISPAMMQKIDKQDKDAVELLFQFATQLRGSTPLPPDFSDGRVAQRAFTQAAADKDARLNKLIAKGALDSAGKINWTKGGCWSVSWNATGSRATALKHISGREFPLPDHLVITKEYALIDNHLDAAARLELVPFGSSSRRRTRLPPPSRPTRRRTPSS